MFKLGQKVVCKHTFKGRDKEGFLHDYLEHPVKGGVYVVVDFGIYGSLYLDGFNRGCYNKSKFEPLSDITINEVIEELKKQPETV